MRLDLQLSFTSVKLAADPARKIAEIAQNLGKISKNTHGTLTRAPMGSSVQTLADARSEKSFGLALMLGALLRSTAKQKKLVAILSLENNGAVWRPRRVGFAVHKTALKSAARARSDAASRR